MTTMIDARTAFTMLPPCNPVLSTQYPVPVPPRSPGGTPVSPRPGRLQFFADAQLRAPRARIFHDFLARRADRLLRHDPQPSARRLLLEGPLHQAVFQRVKGDHGAPRAAPQVSIEHSQELLEVFQLPVDRDP